MNRYILRQLCKMSIITVDINIQLYKKGGFSHDGEFEGYNVVTEQFEQQL